MASTHPKPRLADVAREAAVSVSTVSAVLTGQPGISDDTKRRVLEHSQRMGYRPKTAARVGQSVKRIGLASLGGADLKRGSDTDKAMLVHLSRICTAYDARVEFIATARGLSVTQAFDTVSRFSEGLDGVLLLEQVDPALCRKLRRGGIPHVALGHLMRTLGDASPLAATTVGFDNVAMGYLATSRLIACGHQRVAFVAEELPAGLSHDRWLRGYKLALGDAAVPYLPELVQITGQVEGGAAPAVEQILKLSAQPTAYVTPDTRLAASLVQELARRGIDLPRNHIIFEAIEPNVTRMGLELYPHILGRLEGIAEQSFLQLCALRQKPDAGVAEIIVPFDAFNLPEPSRG